MLFAPFFFRAELGGVQMSVSDLNFSLSGCCVALLNFWCPEVRLELFKVSRDPCSILTFGCPEVRLDFFVLLRDVDNLDSSFRFEVPIRFLDRPLDTAC